MTQARDRRCVACTSRRATPAFADLVRCDGCGLVYYPAALSDPRSLYGSAYYFGAEYADYVVERTALEANFRRRIRTLSSWLDPGRSVFEIGCAYGFFLNLARERWRVAGCDIAEEPVRHARDELGLDVVRADFRDVELRPGEVDLFGMWDTIEHVEPLEDYLARLSDLLRAGGLLAVTTGDIGSVVARLRGEKWRQIHPPTHIWYFSVPTLHRTLRRFGLEPIYTRHVGMTRSIRQIMSRLFATGDGAGDRLPGISALGRLHVWMNTFDLMMVVAARQRSPSGSSSG